LSGSPTSSRERGTREPEVPLPPGPRTARTTTGTSGVREEEIHEEEVEWRPPLAQRKSPGEILEESFPQAPQASKEKEAAEAAEAAQPARAEEDKEGKEKAEREAAAVRIQCAARGRAAQKAALAKKRQHMGEDDGGRRLKLNARERRRLGLHREYGAHSIPFEADQKDRLEGAGSSGVTTLCALLSPPRGERVSLGRPSETWKRGKLPAKHDKVLLTCCDEDFMASGFQAQVVAVCLVGEKVWCAQVDDNEANGVHSILIRDLETGKVPEGVKTVTLHSEFKVSTMCAIHDGNERRPTEVWVGMRSGVISVHGCVTTTCFKEIRHHQGVVTAITVEKSGECIWSGGEDFGIAVWDIKGRHLWNLDGHRGKIHFMLPMGPRMWSGAQDGCIRVWSNGSTDCLHQMPACTEKKPDQEALFVEFDSKQAVKNMAQYGSPTAAVRAGESVWVGYDNGTVRVWSSLGHHLMEAIPDVAPRLKRVSSMQLMGEHVWASGQADGIYVFDRASMKRLHVHKGHGSYINQICRVGWFERRVLWSVSRGEAKVNIWEKVTSERGPDGYAERAANLITETKSLEEHRQHLAGVMETMRDETRVILGGLEANADLYAEEGEELARLLFRTQHEKHTLQLQHDNTCAALEKATAERDAMWKILNETRDDSSKVLMTKYMNRMRFIECVHALFAWRDNMIFAESAARRNAILAEDMLVEGLRHRADTAETELAQLHREVAREQRERCRLEQQLEDLVVSEGGGPMLIRLREASQSVYKVSQVARHYAAREAPGVGNPKDRQLAVQFANTVTAGIGEARRVLHGLEEQVKRALGPAREKLYLEEAWPGREGLASDPEPGFTPDLAAVKTPVALSETAKSVLKLPPSPEAMVPRQRLPGSPPVQRSVVEFPEKTCRIIHIHTSSPNSLVKEIRGRGVQRSNLKGGPPLHMG